MATLYDHIADGLRRNVPDALFTHLNERIWVAADMGKSTVGDTYARELPELARQLNAMTR